MQQASQHKRSLSFNHHLSYNQYSTPNASNVGTLNHKQMIDPSLQHVQLREKPDQPAPGPAKTNSKGNFISIQTFRFIDVCETGFSKSSHDMNHILSTIHTSRIFQTTNSSQTEILTFIPFHSTANWNISCLRPAAPLRPTLTNSSGSSGAILANTKKNQPTYEEDALVLRVIEAYCTAYQNPTRNALHSG